MSRPLTLPQRFDRFPDDAAAANWFLRTLAGRRALSELRRGGCPGTPHA